MYYEGPSRRSYADRFRNDVKTEKIFSVCINLNNSFVKHIVIKINVTRKG